MDAARDYPKIHKIPSGNLDTTLEILATMRKDNSAVPLFIWTAENHIRMIPLELSELTFKEGDEIVYLGKNLNFREVNTTVISDQK